MFSVICTSLYLMTENLGSTSPNLQFEPNKVYHFYGFLVAVEECVSARCARRLYAILT